MVTRIKQQNNDVEVPTTRLYLDDVVLRTACHNHGAPVGSACWTFWGGTDGTDENVLHEGICNDRARRAGMDHPIRPTSLDRSILTKPRPKN